MFEKCMGGVWRIWHNFTWLIYWINANYYKWFGVVRGFAFTFTESTFQSPFHLPQCKCLEMFPLSSDKCNYCIIISNLQIYIGTLIHKCHRYAYSNDNEKFQTLAAHNAIAHSDLFVFMWLVNLHSAKSLPSKQTWINNCPDLLTGWNWCAINSFWCI